MTDDLEDIIMPNEWPDKELYIRPGDFSKVLQGHMAVDDNRLNDPITCADPSVRSGGIIYFDEGVDDKGIKTVLDVMGVYSGNKDYCAFIMRSSDPLKDKYLSQLRIVGKMGLLYRFDAIGRKEYDNFKQQDIDVKSSIVSFICSETSRFYSQVRQDVDLGLNSSRYKLGFGFIVEDQRNHVYRIFSRVRCVGK